MDYKKYLNESQENVLLNWIEVNNIEESSLEIEDDCLYGIRIFGKTNSNNEWWEIDFLTK